MSTIQIILKKELVSFFNSLIAYLVVILFLGVTGFFTWLYGTDIFFVGEVSLRYFFEISKWVLLFFIPAITMKMITEEKRTGTIELLLSMPITERQLILGKFFAALSLVAISLFLTIPYVITLIFLGEIDFGVVFSGYLGLLLLSSMYVSIGIFASSIAKNQVESFLIALVIGVCFHLIFGILSNAISGFLGNIFAFLDAVTHVNNLSGGVIDSRNIIFFVSVSLLGLILSEQILYGRKIN